MTTPTSPRGPRAEAQEMARELRVLVHGEPAKWAQEQIGLALEALMAERDAAQGQVAALRAWIDMADPEHTDDCAKGGFDGDCGVECDCGLDAIMGDTQAAARTAHDTAVAQHAREEEREACAKVAEGAGQHARFDAMTRSAEVRREIANAIRARKESGR